MATVPFDTLKFVEKLRAAGVSEGQAKAEAEALAFAIGEAMDLHIATRADIDRIERKLIAHDGEFTLIKWMLSVLLGGVMALVLKAFFAG